MSLFKFSYHCHGYNIVRQLCQSIYTAPSPLCLCAAVDDLRFFLYFFIFNFHAAKYKAVLYHINISVRVGLADDKMYIWTHIVAISGTRDVTSSRFASCSAFHFFFVSANGTRWQASHRSYRHLANVCPELTCHDSAVLADVHDRTFTTLYCAHFSFFIIFFYNDFVFSWLCPYVCLETKSPSLDSYSFKIQCQILMNCQRHVLRLWFVTEKPRYSVSLGPHQFFTLTLK